MFAQTALESCDSYKLGHADQYPADVEVVYSNFTPRSNKLFNVPEAYKPNYIVWVGHTAFIQEFHEVWQKTFFDKDISVVDDFVQFAAPFAGPNGFNGDRLRDLHALGYLPLAIKALPEGTLVPIGVPVLTVCNTDPKFAWLPNFIETWLSAELWKAPTAATTAHVYRNILNAFVEKTGANKEFADWQIHDFSVRGMSNIRDAAKTGFGHLCSSLGTDNLPAVAYVNQFYGGKQTFVGGSVPATEHSVMCAGGKESELETFRRLLKTYPSGVVSIVSDTWDFWNVITNLAVQLKDEILARTPDSLGLAKVVFRPDSGDPVKIITGYKWTDIENVPAAWDADISNIEAVFDKNTNKYHEVEISYDFYGYPTELNLGKELSRAEVYGAVAMLEEVFGSTTNEQGYRTLNQRVGLIYGDSITPIRELAILTRLKEVGFAADNIVFGVGSYTYQYSTRDTMGFAMKATAIRRKGSEEFEAIFKDPITDSGTKKSAKGLLAVVPSCEDGTMLLMDNVSIEQEKGGWLESIYYNGEMTAYPVSISEIRNSIIEQTV